MTLIDTERAFVPGTTGWCARDLDDPAIERQWFAGRYEIIEGVLTTMPPAYYIGGKSIVQLMLQVSAHVGNTAGNFAVETDIIISEDRVIIADAVFLTPEQEKLQEAAAKAENREPERTRILIPPLLIIESVSPGHERHDQHTKRRWYAEFGVPNYWILNAFERSLLCLRLHDAAYETDASGQNDELITPSLFPGLSLRLAELWA